MATKSKSRTRSASRSASRSGSKSAKRTASRSASKSKSGKRSGSKRKMNKYFVFKEKHRPAAVAEVNRDPKFKNATAFEKNTQVSVVLGKMYRKANPKTGGCGDTPCN